jgi:hypothetical protein
MKNSILLGWWRYMLKVPPFLQAKKHAEMKARMEENLSFMTEDHRRVHHCVVRKLPDAAAPLTPDWIAGKVGLPVARTIAVLKDLEEHMTFLFRTPQGDVLWAYPVTREETPHRVTFDTGAEVYAA